MNGISTSTSPAGSTPQPVKAPLRKKKPGVNPLVKPKQRRPLVVASARRNRPAALPAVAGSSTSTPPAPASRQATPGPDGSKPEADHGGWSTPAPPGTTEYPIYIPRKALRENLRFHVMRLQTVGGRQVDPTDPGEFPRPLYLYRRDISAPSISEVRSREDKRKLNIKEEGTVIDHNAEAREVARQQREVQEQQRLFNEQQVAPTPDAGKPKAKKNQFMKAYKNQATEEGRAESNSMYEENLPWHLEDDQGSINYVGSHQTALSQLHVALLPDPAGRAAFHMVPVEKWYRFKEQPKKFEAFSSEEAEKIMKGKVKMPLWFVRNRQAALLKKEAEHEEGAAKVFSRTRVKQERGGSDAEEVGGQDAGDVDFEEDRFQDDEENELFEGDDEDKKEAKDKMEKEQLQANIFGLNDEGRVDQAEAQKKKKRQQVKKQKRRVERALEEYEGQGDYLSADSSRPSWGSSESDSEPETDEELGKTNKKRKSDELEIIVPGDQSEKEEPSTKKQKLLAGGKAGGRSASKSRAPKGAVGVLKKDATRKGGTSSENATSGGSGTESPRKRPKKSMLGPSRAPATGTSTPIIPPSHSPPLPQPKRPESPPTVADGAQRKASILKLNLGSGTPLQNGKRASVAGSGSESDNQPLAKRAKTNKIRLVNSKLGSASFPVESRLGTNQPSPDTSRAPSPRAGSRSPANSPASPRRSPAGSKPGSPTTRPAVASAARSPSYVPATQMLPRAASPALASPPLATELTPYEFLALIPIEGTIKFSQLIESLKPRVRKHLGPIGQKNKLLIADFLKKYTQVLEGGTILMRNGILPEDGTA